MGPHTSLTAKNSWRVLLTGVTALAMTAGIATAQAPAPVEPPKVPLPLSRITAPDINKLGLLDCTGPGMLSPNPAIPGGPPPCSSQYSGFPITKPNQKQLLVAFGKALFWDMQIGSDGIQACASCHFHAGADNRINGQLNPGKNRVSGKQVDIKNALKPSLPAFPDTVFTKNPHESLAANGHFPVVSTPLPDPVDQRYGNNDIVSSQGVFARKFDKISDGRVDDSLDANDINGFGNALRRVPPRNSPSAIGAVYNLRNFWDGRANLFFNGKTPFGMLDPGQQVNTTTGPIKLRIPFSSLASQAVGPPLSDFEMQFEGRAFSDIANKVLRPLPADGVEPIPGQFRPLNRQQIGNPSFGGDDSVLGQWVDTNGRGLKKSYTSFIQDIFQDKFWNDGTDGTGPNSLMKQNFALFFGLAVQAYEATLIPDPLQHTTPLDVLLEQLNAQGRQPVFDPVNPNLEGGLAIFLSGRASCSACHFGSETTSASVSHLTGFGDPVLEAAAVAGVPVPPVALAERMVMGDGSKAAYDTGFYNIGVRPTADDLSIFGRTGQGTAGAPLSFGLLAQEILRGDPAVTGQGSVNELLLSGDLKLPASSTNLAPVNFAITVACAPGGRGQARGVVNGQGCRPLNTNEHIAVRGSFKTPGLRNLKFTGPYFHNGSASSIEEAVNFYDRGGDFNLAFNPDGCKNNNKNCIIGQVDFDAEIAARQFTQAEKDALVILMRDGMTDSRVAFEQAPFDHPQLCLPNGSGSLVDLPATGQGGHPGSSILTFQEMLNLNNPPTGWHDMKTSCQMVSPGPTVNFPAP